MAVNQITLAQITNGLQSFYAQMNTTLLGQWLTFANDIIAIGTTALQAAPYSLSSGDASAVFNAAQDMANFAKVWQGLMYVTAGATLNSGVPTNNDGTHFGYPFNSNPSKVAGLGY